MTEKRLRMNLLKNLYKGRGMKMMQRLVRNVNRTNRQGKNLILKGVFISFRTHPQTSRMTEKWLRMNLLKI